MRIIVLISFYTTLLDINTSTYPLLVTRVGVNSTDQKWVRSFYTRGVCDGSVQGCDNLGEGPNQLGSND